MGTMNHVLDESLVQFLRNAAVEGESLESLITDVFTETFEEDPGPLLGQFSVIVLNKLGVKNMIGAALLDSLHNAARRGKDIYQHIDELERTSKRNKRLPIPRSTKQHNFKTVGYSA